MRELLMDAFAVAMRDPDVGVVVITGAGGNFSAGSDLTRVAEQDTPARVERMALFQRFVLGWRDAPKPVIVAVEGSAAGGGLSMALVADWAVAAEDAFFLPGWLRIGLVPDVACVWLLSRVLGEKRAWDWIVRGGRMDGAAAAEAGVVTDVCEPGDALTRALRIADSAVELPTHALTATKRLFRLALASHPSDFLLGELYAEAYLFGTADHREGVASFLEKRHPDWRT